MKGGPLWGADEGGGLDSSGLSCLVIHRCFISSNERDINLKNGDLQFHLAPFLLFILKKISPCETKILLLNMMMTFESGDIAAQLLSRHWDFLGSLD